MSHNLPQTIPTQPVFQPPSWLVSACVAGIIIGLLGLILGFVFGPALDAWAWLILNFLWFGSLAQAMLAWAAIFRVAQARWTPAVNRLGHAVIGFLPVSYLALIVLLIGLGVYEPWAKHPIPAKAPWLNAPFMVVRDLVLVGALSFMNYLMVRWTLAGDARAARGEAFTEREHRRLNALAIGIIYVYVFAQSVVALDFIMALFPSWISTMFPAYYFISNLVLAMSVLVLMGGLLRGRLGAEQYLTPDQFHDMGNLILGFSLFAMGLFFAQYLTIWYGDLPLETPFLVFRYLRAPWAYLGWIAFFLGYVVPFVTLIPRDFKRHPRWMRPVTVCAVIGIFLDRYVLVVPSLTGTRLWLWPLAGLVTLGFLGAFILAVVGFLARYSPVSAPEAELTPLDELELVEE